MKARLILFFYVVMLLSAVVLATKALAQEQQQAKSPPVVEAKTIEAKTIIESAQAAGNFNTFLKVLEAAGLTDTLKGGGPYTVFAPTDEAFAKLPQGTVDDWLKDKEQLKKVLLSHVVSGTITAKDAANLNNVKSLAGQELVIQATEGRLKINNATVAQPDIKAANGVIHSIDTVIEPVKVVPPDE
jgi:uncharacterized surface protein with fasciclin (FAS1) repeats